MHVILHAGAHFTEAARLTQCLVRNAKRFEQQGIVVPKPDLYQADISHYLSAPSSPEHQAPLDFVAQIGAGKDASRLILSHAHVLGPAKASATAQGFYPRAAQRLRRIQSHFSNGPFELFVAIRNPATFLPKALHVSTHETMSTMLEGVDPANLRWSDVLTELRNRVPEMRITCWCNEDAPLLWGRILREMADLPDGEKIAGAFDLLSTLMSQEGMRRFRAYLRTHPDMLDVQKRRVMSAFLNTFADPGALEEEIDVPGWDHGVIEALNAAYDADVDRISGLTGVRLLRP